MINLSTWWIKPLAIGLVAASLFGAGYYKGYEHEKATFVAFKAITEDEAKTQLEHNKVVMQEQAKVTSDIILDRDKSLTELRKYYENKNNVIATFTSRVPSNSPSGSEVSSLSNSTETIDANAQSGGSGSIVIKTVTVEDCSEDVLTLLELQKWNKEQAAIK